MATRYLLTANICSLKAREQEKYLSDIWKKKCHFNFEKGSQLFFLKSYAIHNIQIL